MSSQLVIVGGGIAGLLAAYVLREHRPTIVSPELGGTFGSGGLKYLADTDEYRRLLIELDIPFEPVQVRGGVLLGGDVLPWPPPSDNYDHFKVREVQRAHWHKTRGAGVPFDPTCMNDPDRGPSANRALNASHQHLIDELTIQAAPNHVKASVETMYEREMWVTPLAQLAQRGRLPVLFTHAIVTLPLFVLKRIVPFSMPNCSASKLTIVNVDVPWPHADFDYIYTPEARAVHRISRDAKGFISAEAASVHPEADLARDIQEMFPGAGDEHRTIQLPGHLHPLETEPEWPPNIRPLGRFAEWRARATSDVVLETLNEWNRAPWWTKTG